MKIGTEVEVAGLGRQYFRGTVVEIREYADGSWTHIGVHISKLDKVIFAHENLIIDMGAVSGDSCPVKD